MKSITKITIPQPCHQQWQNMNDAQGGRYCTSCAKTVVDFTFMSNQQIINYLSNANNVCGRIGMQQFNSVNRQLEYARMPKTAWWKRAALALSMFTTITYAKARSNTNTQQETQQGQAILLGKVKTPDNQTAWFITGKVLDAKGEALIGACIIAGTQKTIAGVDGSFTIKIIAADIKKLKVTYLGYKPLEIAIKTATNKTYENSFARGSNDAWRTRRY